MALDVKSLKPGDEVGVTWQSLGGQCKYSEHVEAIEEDGMIRVTGHELPFWPDDGREVEIV
ncbi:hypothetical protein [Singulisphaera acidiphila]|uniref:Uncharacterized protein n=1 Tax=Singulisphaera acidiphila (strain ATCC BAA-1392 / DSM 18658 / VKM B-2454 / MOB10) TaxID=886293 RepID=L0DTE8_SINAD|nr:hypothetical protein [Singulisphaera acidiphila]AGA31646.1 hypothetical protein Sinac_7615 [Singulisphaera acidiphila DSM 18658]